MTVGVSPAEQALAALLSLALGGCLGVLYDLLRGVRRNIRGLAAAGLLDALFWLVSLPALALLGLRTGGGELRLFTVLSAAVGATAYFALISPTVLRFFEKICRALLLPLKNSVKKLKKLFSFAVKRFRIKERIEWLNGFGGKKEHEIQKARYIYVGNNSGALNLRCDDHGRPEGKDRRGGVRPRFPRFKGRGHDREK